MVYDQATTEFHPFDQGQKITESQNSDQSESWKSASLQERLDEMQADVRLTQRMICDLTVFVRQQFQPISSNHKNKSPREVNSLNVPDSGKSLCHQSLPVNGVTPKLLLPSDPLDTAHAIASSCTDTRTATQTNGRINGMPDPDAALATFPQPPAKLKKKSLGLAVLNTELMAFRKSLIRTQERRQSQADDASRECGAAKTITQSDATEPATVTFERKHLSTRNRDPVTRRFSVFSTLDVQNATKKRLKRIFTINQQTDATVSPEEIISARNLEGELGSFTLYHDSPYRHAWDLLIMAMILVDVILTPLTLGFHFTPNYMESLNICGTVLFVIDFVVHIFSSYTDERGDLISGPKQTATNYLLSGWAIPDFLSWFPFESFASSSKGRVLGFTKIFRLAKVSHVARKFNSAKKAGILRFVLLLSIVLTIVHLLACYWSWVASGWRAHLDGNTFVPQTLFEEYALCWSLVIGCLNASPPPMYTAIEQISVACFMLIGNILQASVFGSVAVLISSFDEDQTAYNKKIISTSERCRFLGISDKLTKRIRGYYENLWRETKSVNCDADAFINELSPALICEVKFQLYRDMLKQIPFLSAKTLAPAVIEMLILP